MIRATLISMFLLVCYALGHAASNRAEESTENRSTLARVDTVLAKICYPLCLLIHIIFIALVIASVVSGWKEDFPLGIAMGVLGYGVLGLIVLWCSLAFVPSWFSADRVRNITRLTLIMSLVELILGLVIYVTVTIGVLP